MGSLNYLRRKINRADRIPLPQLFVTIKTDNYLRVANNDHVQVLINELVILFQLVKPYSEIQFA